MPTSRIVVITSLLTFATVYLFRLYKRGNAANRSAVIKLVFFALILPIPSIASALNLPSWIQPPINFGPQYYGGIIGCLAVNQIIYNKHYVPIIKNGLFPIVTIIYIPLIILAYIERDDFVIFTDNKPFLHTWLYYTLTALDYFIMLYISAYLTYKLRIRRGQNMEPELRTRYTLAYIGTTTMVIGYIMVEVNVLLSAVWSDALLQTINSIYQYILILGVSPFLLSFLIPRHIIKTIIKCRKSETKSIEQQALLHYLHQNITKITPEVILQKNTVHTEDLVTEIADSLLIIRSCRKQSFISARHEAKIILALVQNSQMLMPNGYTEVPNRYNDITYYVKLAKQLKRLETKI